MGSGVCVVIWNSRYGKWGVCGDMEFQIWEVGCVVIWNYRYRKWGVW